MRYMPQQYARKAVTKIDLLIGIFVVTVLILLMVPSFSVSNTAARRKVCLANLEQIGRGLTAYLEDSGQSWPCVAKLRTLELHDPPWPTLPTVIGRYIGDRSEVFQCPADRRELDPESPLVGEFGRTTTWWQTEGSSYEWLMGEAYCGKKVGEEMMGSAKGLGMGRADMPLISDFEPFHEGDSDGSFNTLNADLKARTARDNVKR